MAETTTIEKTETAVPTTLKALIEALVFAAQEPLSLGQIKTIYQGESRNSEVRQIDSDAIRKIVDELNKEYGKADRPYRIVSIAGGYQFATIAEYAEWIGKLYREQGRRKLSQSGVETLAIIAYKQPITKSEIEKIRGVNCDYVLKTLLEKELVTIVGRAEAVGRPLLYGTTKEFLKHFGLNDLTDLPRPREIEEILGESQFETERRMLEAQAGAEAMKQEQEQFKSRLPHIPKKKSELDEKDATIAPHKKVREIKILSADEKKALEEAGQTPIDFSPETASTETGDETPEVEDTIAIVPEEPMAEEPRVEQPDIPAEIVSQPEETKVDEPLKNFPDEPIVPQEVIEASIEPPAEILLEAETLIPPAELKVPVVKLEEMVPSEQATSEHTVKPKWRTWKEKIQGFIKKLFA
ncbi:MAG TPA: SMC-Scp complex subunit ScpB [Bacteroidota bacterium]|nr:SMC-Scp complex subunit ScpB [Bacteroidota bacterium]